MDRQEINKVLQRAKELGMDIGSIDPNSISSAELKPRPDKPEEFSLSVTYTQEVK
jgi:hypothetical protein